MDWASQGLCNYTIFVGVVLFVVSSIQVYRLSLLLYRGQDSSFISAFGDVLISSITSLLNIIAALLITLGFGKHGVNLLRKDLKRKSLSIFYVQTSDIYVFIGEPKSCSYFITNGAKLRLSYKYIHIIMSVHF